MHAVLLRENVTLQIVEDYLLNNSKADTLFVHYYLFLMRIQQEDIHSVERHIGYPVGHSRVMYMLK